MLDCSWQMLVFFRLHFDVSFICSCCWVELLNPCSVLETNCVWSPGPGPCPWGQSPCPCPCPYPWQSSPGPCPCPWQWIFKVLVLVLVLDPQVLVLVLVLVTEVLVNITGKRRREKASTTFSRDGFLLSRGTKWNHTEILRYKHCLS